MSDKYNGWTNYATWRVNLELLDDYCDSLLRDGSRFNSQSDLADALKEYVDAAITNFGENEEGIAVDYARSFVADVNYYEIAESCEELYTEPEEDEDEDDEDEDDDD